MRDGSLVAGGDAAVAEGVSAEELRGNENGYRRSDIWKNIQNPEKNRSFGTIIDNCINIGTDLNLNTVGQVVFLLATQVVAFGGSLFFAKLSRKKDTVSLILICIAGYFVICLYALTLRTLVHFAILAFGVGCFQGSIQSLSRSYYSKIIPAENSGEYFGIYDIFAKGASFLGSVVIAVVKLAGGTINVAVACLAVFFALGFVFLKIADHQPMAGEK